MKRICALVAFVMLSACVSAGGTGPAFTPSHASSLAPRLQPDAMKLTGTYFVPSFGCVNIDGMVAGPDRRMWFTEFSGDAIGAITTSGTVSVYATGSGTQPNGIAVRRKTIWAGGYGGTMFKSTRAGALTPFSIAGSHIGDIVEGPDKNLWFTDYGNDKIGRITPAGAVTEFPLPPGAAPSGIAVGADKNFWITDGARRKIVKMSSAGTVLKSYGRGLSKGEYLEYIVAAPDGKLYFTEYSANVTTPDKIGRISSSGKITEIGTLPSGAYPNRLAVGKDGNVYFAMGGLQAVGKIVTATGKTSFTYLPLTRNTGTNSIAEGPDKRLWLGSCYTIYAVSY